MLLTGWILLMEVPRPQWLKELPAGLLSPSLGTPLLVGSVPPGWVVDRVAIPLSSSSACLLVGLSARATSLWVEAWAL
jgi:hypothetical protein